ncbi:TRAP transporter small permease [Acuticoccus sp. MNP-M23]|uniref:TRAP transporter small permease n=1 Tax=Acuticoccus sp. MNP-M23 TaxID=3072793 RepID=UPI002814FC1C|nr:TRAP transporter small permease [Acuticoccus sp. MNP-M23]WMS41540.1 TRAP transporter small permease [Acuticoccus sp. MNP-M23]
MMTESTALPSEPAPREPVLLKAARIGLTVLRRLIDVIAIVLFSYMTVAIAAQIAGRYVFNFSIAWTEETATFAQIWLVLLGAGIAMRNRQHVGIDILVSRCPPMVQRLAQGTAFLLGTWLLLVIIVSSFGMLSIGMIVKSPALRLPLAIPYAALPVGVSYFLLEFAIATLPTLIDPSKRLSTVEVGE